MAYCLQISSRHVMQTEVSELKIISLRWCQCTLWWCLWWVLQVLPLFSYSFDGVYSTFFQVLTKMSCSFIISFVTLGRLKKCFELFFTSQKIHHHHQSACFIVGFLHQCIYTPQHIPEDDNLYLVYIQNRSLTQPLHCNTYHMEHLDHENLFLCFLSTDVLLFCWFCRHFFK